MRKKGVTWGFNPGFQKISLEFTGSNYVPGRLTFDPPTLRISRQELIQAREMGFLDDVLSEYTVEEREQERLGLSSWVDEKFQESGLELTDEAKVMLVNIMALIMKKTSQMLQEE